jgi:hypothetical protein
MENHQRPSSFFTKGGVRPKYLERRYALNGRCSTNGFVDGPECMGDQTSFTGAILQLRVKERELS